MADASENCRPTYVSDLRVELRNKEFASPWKIVEMIIDLHCAGNKQSIAYQGENELEITWENLVRIDHQLMEQIHTAITPKYYKDMKIIAPCTSHHTADDYAPLALVIQFKLPSHVIPVNLDGDSERDPYGGNRVNPSLSNLDRLAFPPNQKRAICHILNELHTDIGNGVGVFLKKVMYAAEKSTLIIIDPPTYNYEFIDRLVNRYPGVIESVVFEQTPREAEEGNGVTMLIKLFNSRLAGANPSSGYIRAKPIRSGSKSGGGFLSRLGWY